MLRLLRIHLSVCQLPCEWVDTFFFENAHIRKHKRGTNKHMQPTLTAAREHAVRAQRRGARALTDVEDLGHA